MARLHNATAGAVQRDRETFAIHTARLMSAGSPTDTSGATLEKMPDTADRKTDTAHRGGGQGTGAGSAFPASQDHRSVVVLKGAGTIVTDGISLYVNKTGNPGMATGGSGDVLTGVIAALIGQGLSCFDAAVLGVHVHGLAGDRAAEQLGEVSLTASDLIDYLPAALRRTLQTPPRPRR
ncbi:MAG: NAD(P)H-hydrate dehydratase [Phycisphaerae bacterium]|nr:NAD(P)H-hydrate dehydratase [Phycisphaerae bacterium]